MKKVTAFWTEEDGAITVDWVVLTAAVIALAMAAFTPVLGGVTSLGDAINAVLAALEV